MIFAPNVRLPWVSAVEIGEPNHDVRIAVATPEKPGPAQVVDPFPYMRGHVAIAALAQQARIDQHDHIRPFVGMAALVPCEFGLPVREPLPEGALRWRLLPTAPLGHGG